MEEQKSKRTPITRPKFLEISKHLKEGMRLGVYNAKDLADQYGVSAETIRAVRRAGTWPQWVRNKQAVRQRRGSGASDIPPVAPVKWDATKSPSLSFVKESTVTGPVVPGLMLSEGTPVEVVNLTKEDYENVLHRLDRLEKRVAEIQKTRRGLFGRKPKVRQW